LLRFIAALLDQLDRPITPVPAIERRRQPQTDCQLAVCGQVRLHGTEEPVFHGITSPRAWA